MMKVIITNKKNPNIKQEYTNPINISVQRYINPDIGYDGSPIWCIELGSGYNFNHASFKCSEWNIEII